MCTPHLYLAFMPKTPQSRYSYSWQSCEPKGPVLLLSAATNLMSSCKTFGWRQFENVLVDAAEKLFLYNSTSVAVSFVDKLAAEEIILSQAGGLSRICNRVWHRLSVKRLFHSKLLLEHSLLAWNLQEACRTCEDALSHCVYEIF